MREQQYRAVLEARTRRPGVIAEAAARRARPASLFNQHGRLMIIAADHPARGALRAGERALAMADRVELLDRLRLALSRPGVNGLLGTPDIVLSPEATIRAMTVAAGLGTTSAYTWLKVPVVDDMEPMMAATTLPALPLGGEVSADQEAAFACRRKALKLPIVCGLVIGRSLLSPPDDDVAAAVDTAVGLLREESA